MAEKEGAGNRVAGDGTALGYRDAIFIIGYWRQVIWIPEGAIVFEPARIEWPIENKDRA